MAKPTKSDSELVTELIQKLEPDFATLVWQLRTVILKTDKEIGEQIKWNSPAFYYTGEMKAFDPKEYKRDLVVLNLRKGQILMVFPTGMSIIKNTEILEGNYTDGRRMITIKNTEELKKKEKAIQLIIKEWLSLIEK